MTKPITTTYTLTSGRRVSLPATIENVVGVDAEGRIVVDTFDAFHGEDSVVAGYKTTPHVFGLTLCCNAFDKGYEDGVYCRACGGAKRNADQGMYYFRDNSGSWEHAAACVDFVVGTPFAPNPEPAPVGPTTKKESTMNAATKTKKTPAAEQFAALGIPESDWTDTMRMAVKQKWSDLPVGEKIDDLRERLENFVPPPLPDMAEVMTGLLAKGNPVSVEDGEAEMARLKRNANVNAWRTRKQIQAAIDARDLRFKAMRAKRASAKTPKPPKPRTSGGASGASIDAEAS